MVHSPVTRLSIVDDHTIFRKSFIKYLNNGKDNYHIILEADNGNDLIEKLKQLDKKKLPQIIIVDINMPGMDGFATVEWLKKNHPTIKVVVLTMYDDQDRIMHMLRLGVNSYLTKSMEPEELFAALQTVAEQDTYYPALVTSVIIDSIRTTGKQAHTKSIREVWLSLSDRERAFVQFACSELTYNEIAAEMCLSPKTIDNYRISVFEKFKVKTRVGLVMLAIQNGLQSNKQ